MRHNSSMSVMKTAVVTAMFSTILTPLSLSADTGVIVNRDGNAVFFDTDTGLTGTSVALTDGDIGDCEFSPDNDTVYVTNFQSSVNVIDSPTGSPVLSVVNNPISISNFGEDVSFTADGSYVVVADGSAVAPLGIIDTGMLAEIGTADLSGDDHNSVTVCSDGSVLATSDDNEAVYLGSINGSGAITDSGNSLSIGARPNNAYCAPGNQTGIVIGNNGLESFALPGMGSLDTQAMDAPFGLSAVFINGGTTIIAATLTTLESWNYNPTSGDFGSQNWSTAYSGDFTFFGVEIVSVTADEAKVFLGNQVGQILELNPITGAVTDTIDGFGATDSTGICLSNGLEPENLIPVPVMNNMAKWLMILLIGLLPAGMRRFRSH